MKRREFIASLGVVATWPLAALAQQAGRTYRLGALMGHPRDVPVNMAFLEEFRHYGFIEGQNFAVDWRAFGKDLDQIPKYAAELVSARVDVITTAGEEATRAAQHATKTIPIVALVDDLLASGLVQSLAKPEGNTTGVSILAVDLDGKRQDLLIEAVPGIRRLAALSDVNNTAAKLQALQEAARGRDVELSIYPIAKAEEIAPAMDKAHVMGATAVNVCAGGVLLWANRQLIIDHAATLHLPTMHGWPEEAEEGAFAAYGARLGRVFVEVMPQQIIRLFRGAKVAEVPVEQPTTFELVINLKTAKAMGVTVSPGLLARADKVIE
jgi:putative ABC transport system substrate-binding protein